MFSRAGPAAHPCRNAVVPGLSPVDSIFFFQEFCEFRAKCGLLWCYDWVSIPMVYTQVVTLATYLFFIFTIIGRQKIDGYHGDKRMPSGRYSLDIDLYIPIYTVLQFFFYMGLLKVAEQLINPFGDDDEDFELNWLIDRHVKVLPRLINQVPRTFY